MRYYLPALLAFAIATPSSPRSFASRVDYELRIDSAGSHEIAVIMHVTGAPAEFRVAMATHAEYDDQYWRYLADLRGTSSHGAVTITREDSAVWRVHAPPGAVELQYRVRFPESPPMQQASWKAHLTSMGGLIGGPHSFLYVVGGEQAPSRVTLALPAGWQVAAGLEHSAGVYTAAHAEALIDSPIMVGRFRSSRFVIDGVPHDVAFLGAAGGVSFDTMRVMGDVERFAHEAVRMFGRMPYTRYQFLLEDGAQGGLEHLNSVSIGVQSANLARDPTAYLGQIAHEFFHTWNEVHLRPTAWIGIRHVPPAPTGELWLSEGVTLYYADLLLRRAGLTTPDSTRVAHVQRMITNYLANPSQAMVSPEATSRAFNLQGATGDYTPSMFTQGELLGTVLDLMIVGATDGRRSLDDVMRTLSSQFSVTRGFTSGDVERAVTDVCRCDVHEFFETRVRAAGALDFDRALASIGMHTVVTSTPARALDGTAVPDLRVSAWTAADGPCLQIGFPATAWGRAGLHTGDRLVSWNGVAMTVLQFRAALGALHVGDTVRVAVARDSGPFETTVVVSGYERPTVRIELRADATSAQRTLFAKWAANTP